MKKKMIITFAACFMLNLAAQSWLDELQLPEGSWQTIESVPEHIQ